MFHAVNNNTQADWQVLAATPVGSAVASMRPLVAQAWQQAPAGALGMAFSYFSGLPVRFAGVPGACVALITCVLQQLSTHNVLSGCVGTTRNPLWDSHKAATHQLSPSLSMWGGDGLS
jgi:hypothetical protein